MEIISMPWLSVWQTILTSVWRVLFTLRQWGASSGLVKHKTHAPHLPPTTQTSHLTPYLCLNFPCHTSIMSPCTLWSLFFDWPIAHSAIGAWCQNGGNFGEFAVLFTGSGFEYYEKRHIKPIYYYNYCILKGNNKSQVCPLKHTIS